jgi:hypothetical protein
MILSMSEFGLDLCDVATAISLYCGERRSSKRELFEEGKKAVEKVDAKTKKLQNTIKEKADTLIEEWDKELPSQLMNAVTRKIDDGFVKTSLSREIFDSTQKLSEPDADINAVVDGLLDALNASINGKNDDEIIIYARTSPSTMNKGVPKSSCHVHCCFQSCFEGRDKQINYL